MYGFHDLPVTFSELPIELRQAHAVWLDAKGDAIAPAQSELDLSLMPSIVQPFISVTEYDREADVFTVRYFGRGLAKIDGVDMTNRNLSSTPHEELSGTLRRLFRQTVTEQRENFAEFHFMTGNKNTAMSVSGRWPLSDDGINVTAILAVVYPESEIEDLNHILGRNTSVA